MSIVFIKKISNHAQLGLWKTEETVDQLLSTLTLDKPDQILLETKKRPHRKQEWLAVRNLLNAMLPKNTGIGYTQDGKPFLNDSPYHISISHSGDQACLYLHELHPVGVDIQQLKTDLAKGGDYFLNKMEISHFSQDDPILLNILWSAKESVFKYCDLPELDVKNEVSILPFERNQSGTILVNILHPTYQKSLQLHYELFDQYVLTRTH